MRAWTWTRRHPGQVVELGGFIVGRDYALVFAAPHTVCWTPVTFAGTLDDVTNTSALNAINCHRGQWGLHLTFHYDNLLSYPTTRPTVYALWGPGDALASVPAFHHSGDPADLLLDPPESLRNDGTYVAHRLVVALGSWKADPQLHTVGWAPAVGGWAAEEARLKAKKDVELRRLLGF